ncbi:MAG: hydrogenase small subunit [Gammaproteobacteria bacterium]|nr:hydrogenase small subunit [Gammaproteobacteria bacterium]
MPSKETFEEHLRRQGVSRRSFLKFCALTASGLALPTGAAKVIADTLATVPRPTVIWLSSQECTGCSETVLRSFEPSVESLILSEISLDYHNTLMAPSGTAAEDARRQAIAAGGHVLVVDGSVTRRDDGAWSIIGGEATIDIVRESAMDAALIIAIGNCAAYGGLPNAAPNPSDAVGVDELIASGELATAAPLINVPGCPPIPEVITGVIVHFLAFGVPELDHLLRPTVYYGQTVHDSCTRLPYFDAQLFAESFDDEGARQGYCLLNLGCRGPLTFNACSTRRWNGGTSFPMHSGHGCLGCSEPGFWDRAGGFYTPPF